jgi:CspA family cold shock protein
MPSGKVKFFDAAKGYGFLVPDDGGPDLFVHNKAVRRAGLKALVPGETLSFEVTEERGRPEAVALARPASAPPADAAPARRTITLRPRRASRPAAAEGDNKGLESGGRSD